MKSKHFLTLRDFSKEEILSILSVAEKLKQEKKQGKEHHLLKGKTLAMIFEKPSTRTRVAFEVGMYQLGGHAINIRPNEIQMGAREPIRDIARVLSRYVDGIMIRVAHHADIEEFAMYSSVPVINGLSDRFHPCQAVADMLTIKEKKGNLSDIHICYLGDAANNVCASLMNITSKLCIAMTISCPESYKPKEIPPSVTFMSNPREAVESANVIYTDVWTSMGQESEAEKRKKDLKNYAVTKDILANASSTAIFLHCLPAHRGEEVTDDIVESQASAIFDQAENRLHAHKAILATLLS